MTLSYTAINLKEQHNLKRRAVKYSKTIELKFGDGGLIFSKECKVEVKFLKIFKKFLKKIFKKNFGYKYFYKQKCWLNLPTNFPLTKKSKNSRMGKGKGSFVRWTIKVKSGNKLIETKYLSIYRLNCLRYFLQKCINVNVYTFFFEKERSFIYFSSHFNYYWVI